MVAYARRDTAVRELRDLVRNRLLELLGSGVDPDTDAGYRQALAAAEEVLREVSRSRMSAGGEPLQEIPALATRLVRDILFLGAIQEYLDDPACEEVLYNGPGRQFAVVGGRKQPIVIDADPEDLERNVRRMVGRLGRRLDEASPMVDVALPDGTRLAVVLPPIATHLSLAARRFVLAAPTLEALVEKGTLTTEVAGFLAAAVRSRLTVLVSGGTASGKTTFLNALGRQIPPAERVVTVEDTRELQLAKVLPDCVSLQAREANVEGVGAVSIRELVRRSLRLRPTRIIVGEVRGPEAVDMLTAMNSGHEGSMCTLHANSPRDALAKLADFVLRAEGQLPVAVANRMIAAAVDLVVQLAHEPATGRRRVVAVAEVAGMEGDAVVVNELWRADGPDLVWTGVRPRCAGRLAPGPYPWAKEVAG